MEQAVQGRPGPSWQLRLKRSWRAARPTLRRINSHRTTLVAAGCAFYATLALFPGISMLVSIYGLAFNPRTVEPQLILLQGLLPPESYAMIARVLHGLVSHRRGSLGVSLGIGAIVTLWSASMSTKSMLSALNLAYDETEKRGLLRFQFTGLAMTLAALVGGVLALALLVALPAATQFLDRHLALTLVHAASLAILMLYVAITLAGLYCFGPSRRPGRAHRILPGTILATLLWLAASLLFTDYVTRIARFDATFGPLGAVAGVMLWFWFSACAVLAGAELNSALELQAGDGAG